MERPKRAAAAKVSNFRTFHLSGDLDDTVKGLVDSRIEQFTMTSTEELKQQLEQERESNKQLEESVEHTCVQHELEVERMKRQQWQVAMDKLQQAKEAAQQEHERCMVQIDTFTHTAGTSAENPAGWLQQQMARMASAGKHSHPTTEEKKGPEGRKKRKKVLLKKLGSNRRSLTGNSGSCRPQMKKNNKKT